MDGSFIGTSLLEEGEPIRVVIHLGDYYDKAGGF